MPENAQAIDTRPSTTAPAPSSASAAGSGSGSGSFTTDEWLRLAGFYGFIGVLHLVGWGLYLAYSASHPALIGLGFVAYLFGLRHAFDADHIAAVDDTVRLLMHKGQRPLGIGFFFSLGHSTIVLGLAVAIAFAASAVTAGLPALQAAGSLVGAGVSGVFLWLIGLLNLLVLLDILKIWRGARTGSHDHPHLDQLMAKRGLLWRLFGGRLQTHLNHSWQMYPLGLLFGLGFDTASEIGLLAMTAGASAGNLPIGAVLSLPILFAAGMSIMDKTDGVLMVRAYHWAFVNPLRKIFYNLATTSLSIAVALVIGSIELLQVLIHLLGLNGRFFDFVGGLDLGAMGFAIVGLFLLGWGASVAVWKFGRFESGGADAQAGAGADGVADSGADAGADSGADANPPAPMHAHAHDHDGLGRHRHEHIH